ncbi:MAG: bifunctional phosphopantothenoylcysteine decarboxylase/phosphopantothenate--cysteine ligase CoaBC [Chloroflexi bacterium]|nr:bifunctional phosphopantothenoylcysteine decarboxylase/phosphopantothenate--cysteine ligase CoaBC [Chloroflexota bacterium]
MYNLTGRNIVLGVTGSIAAYKAADLASKLTQAECSVDVIMTPEAAKFIAPLTFSSVTGRPAYASMWDAASAVTEAHVALSRRADLLVIAPATATTLARFAAGSAEDLVSLTALATRAPILICPAMDPNMFEHPAVQANVETLKARGVYFVGPDEGRLASGQMGVGRLSEVETVMGAIRFVLGRGGDLAAKKIVVTAGGTREQIDPVRYVGNYSSGKMGFAVAAAARDRGADSVLITAPTELADPYAVDVIRVKSAMEMRDAVAEQCARADALVMTAAVADYQPAEAIGEKIKREGRDSLTISLVRTPDILKDLSADEGLIKVGFAAESNDLLENARKKLKSKGVDLIVANDITAEGSGFGADTNQVTLLDKSGAEEELPLIGKYEVASRILDRVVSLIETRQR